MLGAAVMCAGAVTFTAGPASAAPGSQTFSFTGAVQQFTVPAGVTSIHIEADGAQGGGDTGGAGARVEADLTVAPGQVLDIYAGGEGGANAGGFNGGGSKTLGGGYGGGGASDVRTAGGGLDDRLLAAGGGSSGGLASDGEGGAAGSDGADGAAQGAVSGGQGGEAGTASQGGAGGTGGFFSDPGTPGVQGTGGTGGLQTADAGGLSNDGGSGGGGLYGGGGGGSGTNDATDISGGGGGGGGSSLDPDGGAAPAAAAAGNGKVTITYDAVTYSFTGFFAPVDSPPVVNEVNAGRTVPVKFSLGGDQGLDILAPGSPSSQQVTCNSSAPVDTVETTTSQSGLAYNPATGQYQYNWKTQKAWSGTCRVFTLTLDDGTVHTLSFQFK
ncbi:PxKF domain-containing protein [Streptomyces sp. NPDC096030]|uniref:PxKF domain-containing protein n=1 Tax=Streptomyces sp. NPDC096030 TaxID=3155423 RepID=UPI00332498CD